jgi:UDP-N-acetylglucosamine 1-carboxyvinyltransferase
MDRLVITGGVPLEGEVAISGAKNAALPLIAAALLTEETVELGNVPELADVTSMLRLVQRLGMAATFLPGEPGRMALRCAELLSTTAHYDIVRKMRASVLVLGPLLARTGLAKVALPGGCAIGVRPIDQHLKGFQKLGAEVFIRNGYVEARASRLKGARITTDLVTVTGTENLMMAAALAKGRTTLENAAAEPEVEELATVLNKMGARISGAGTSLITIDGVDELQPLDHAIIADRIEAGTLMVAAAVTRGNVLIKDCLPEHLDAVIAKLRAAGVEITVEPGGVRVRGKADVLSTDIATRPYPGFPTDMQAQFMVLMTLAKGQSVLSENIFENRYMHVPELNRMGADIMIEGRTAIVRGPAKLKGAKVMATDLRASACLVLAGLVGEGTTEVLRVYHLDRGYERLDRKLRALGANIRRTRGSL